MTTRKLSLLAFLLTLCLMGGSAHAQQFDFAFGVSGLSAPAGSTNSSGLFFPTMDGGAYPGFSGDFLLVHHLGVEGELYWRASQNLYGGYQPYRPIFYDFNPVEVFEALAKQFPSHEIVVHSDEYMNHLYVTFSLKDGQVTEAGDPCRCYDEYFSPLSIEDMNALGIEEAP
jgi:hypothetical protein